MSSVQELLENLSQRLQALESENQQLKSTVQKQEQKIENQGEQIQHQQHRIDEQQKQIQELLLSNSSSSSAPDPAAAATTTPLASYAPVFAAAGIQATLQNMNKRLMYAEAGAKVIREVAVLTGNNNSRVVQKLINGGDVEGAVRFAEDAKLYFETDIAEIGVRQSGRSSVMGDDSEVKSALKELISEKISRNDAAGAKRLFELFTRLCGNDDGSAEMQALSRKVSRT